MEEAAVIGYLTGKTGEEGCYPVFNERCFVLVLSLTFSSQLKQLPT